MKNRVFSVCVAVLLGSAWIASAGDMPTAKPGSPEFERLKTLVGTWTGKVDMGDGPVEMTARYRLLAGGSVLEERVFEGTPHEMVTMYYDQNGKVALTHYCVLGNRPAMVLKSADKKSLDFDLDPACGIDVKKESHMHGLKITFDNPDTITTKCKSFMDGKQCPENTTTLKRVKS